MKRTRYDMPIGQCRHGGLQFDSEPEPKRRTLAAIAAEHGIRPNSISNFRIRHPELAHWDVEKIAAQIEANKDQSAVARRQGCRRVPGQRTRFGKMTYEGSP